MWNDILPLGSVVLLTESKKRVMVMGFCQAKPENIEKVYDYCGCLYPEGYMDADHIYLFNHDQIDQIYSVGYMDEEQFAFRDKISDILYKLKANEMKEEEPGLEDESGEEES